MTTKETVPVSVQILGKDYRIACSEPEREALLESARHLDAKMREIKSHGKVIGTDRIAVMAALNITHELLRMQSREANASQTVGKRIRHLQDKIEMALNSANQLEL